MKSKKLLVILGVFLLTVSFLALAVFNINTVMAAGQSVERQRGVPGQPNPNLPEAPMGEQVQDGGFEGGTPNSSWTEYSSNFGTPLCDAGCGVGGGTGPHSGSWWAWFGGIAAYEEGSVSQSVVIPAGTTMMTWWQECPVTSGAAADYLEVNVDGNQEYQILGDDAACGVVGYAQKSLDISAYADGGSHTIEFHSEIFGTNTTNFFVDDVSIIAPDAVPDIAIGISPASQNVTTNGVADFTITVTNTGDVGLINVDVSDPLVSDCDNAIGTLAVSQTVSYGCQDTAVAGSYTNVVTVTSDIELTDGAGPTDSASADVVYTSPTSVSLTGFGEGATIQTPILLGLLALVIVGMGLLIRRKMTA
ncbi:MAG: hypothetical protein WAM60_03455 [Candidatus Promineifilaceae bacterium]